MSTFSYIVAYTCIVIFWATVIFRSAVYLSRPLHFRWGLYPVAHGKKSQVKHGGSYLEEYEWWRNKQKPSVMGSFPALIAEFFLLHNTFRNNRALWYRTYPFHFGLYALAGTVCLAMFAAILALFGTPDGRLLRHLPTLGQFLALAAFVSMGYGALALIYRRLVVHDLKIYSTPKHFFNLGLFLGLSVLGLILWVLTPSFFNQLSSYMASLLTFKFIPQDEPLFNLFIIYLFALTAYIPATHMGHFFMKYFLWHDMRWDDQPTQDNPNTQQKIKKALTYPISWRAMHIRDGKQVSWADAASDNFVGRKGSGGGSL